MAKTWIMLGIICLLALVTELDFFVALPKFGAEHFGAPEDLKELVKKIPNKPKRVEFTGIFIMILCFLGIIADFVWAMIDSYQNYEGYLSVFFRFLIILEGYKLFDIVCFDYLLLTKIKLPERLYPETKGAKGYSSFGFNAKSQGVKILLFALLSAAIAGVFALLCK